MDKILAGQLELLGLWWQVADCGDRRVPGPSTVRLRCVCRGARMQHLRRTQRMQTVSYWGMLPNVTPNS